ncbi:binding partner of ACD11 1 [Iris pallida]|uniref:Binding partner of ACD11 1 n=1 Tax=Iris pallida TaxID=29817 RepID=A0AAX6E1S2_IRIPA|nr:binding partner of ACD11 1 [Iris pallida]
MQTTRTVRVGNVSELAGERDIREFFSFSGDIDHVQICHGGAPKTAFVTFKDPKALEIAVLLSGATIVDQIVSIDPVENYIPKIEQVIVIDQFTSVGPAGKCIPVVEATSNHGSSHVYVSKAHVIMTGVLARGSALRQDAVNKAKAFDEKHQLTANASAKVTSFDKRVGLSEKITVGISLVNDKVKSVDQKLRVSDKTMAALTLAEQKLSDTGSAIKTSRYAAWLNGAFSKVAMAGHVVSAKNEREVSISSV